MIGYSTADHHHAELVADALDMAAVLGRLEPGYVIHSDRGSEYTPTQLRTRIGELRHRQSVGRTGSCFDNAAAESPNRRPPCRTSEPRLRVASSAVCLDRSRPPGL
ncbi:hypothetical protein [Streptomyces mirabilis]|uniref:hypothetical protein n=1 Tax=Streptomyces mirabilis TaxID=68239 RepID=UPI0036DD6065